MHEFQVILSLPVEAETVEGAVEEFRWDVANGPAYVYTVDSGEGLVTYDAENGEITPAERIDKGALDALAVKVYGIAHEADADEAVQTDWDRRNVALIAAELYNLFGLV